MKRIQVTRGLVAFLVIVGLFLAGCSSQGATQNHTPILQNHTANPLQNHTSNQAPVNPQPPQQPVTSANDVVMANNQLAIDLYHELSNKNENELSNKNIFYSPYSMFSALAMTYEGARGKTAEEMRAVLHLPADRIRSDFVRLSELDKTPRPYQLTSVNALWVQKGFPLRKEYLRLVADDYGGKATNLDFGDSENSRATINRWVEKKTHEKIKDLIPRGTLSASTRLVLTNALYFKANWSDKFRAADTKDGVFHVGSGTAITTKMMHQTGYFRYGETKDLQILEMNYRGDDLSMLIILPKDLAQGDAISAAKLAGWKRQMSTKEVRVTLPKFRIETKYFMADDLKRMGMPTAFNPLLANFTGMTEKQQLYISQVIQQTFINVSEAGTEAAAATAVIVKMTAIGPGQETAPKVFTADHPFIFIIQQKKSGNILFMGRMSDPTKE